MQKKLILNFVFIKVDGKKLVLLKKWICVVEKIKNVID